MNEWLKREAYNNGEMVLVKFSTVLDSYVNSFTLILSQWGRGFGLKCFSSVSDYLLLLKELFFFDMHLVIGCKAKFKVTIHVSWEGTNQTN